MTTEAQHLSVSIDCEPARAYGWLSVPENFPQWAAGLATSLREVDGEWVAETPFGAMRIRFRSSSVPIRPGARRWSKSFTGRTIRV